MRNLLFISIILILGSCHSGKSTISIPANQAVELDYPNYEMYRATIKNKSLSAIDVTVRSKSDDTQISGFGLGKMGVEDILVASENKLVIQNNTNSDVSVQISAKPEQGKQTIQSQKSLSFTLMNTSDESIPLIIPNVMNPNLSPNSKSGVDLKIGQEILFKVKGKKYVLLTVDDTIQKGDELDVSKLLEKRKIELGLK